MFCNQCGTQAQENQRFCSKCGKELIKRTDFVCPFCNAQIEADAGFCNTCGKAIPRNEKSFCPYCGTKYQPQEEYCKECGHAFEEKKREEVKEFETFAKEEAVIQKAPSVAVGTIKKLTIQHFIAAGLFLLLIILLFFPTVTLEYSEGFFSEETIKIPFAVGNPLSDTVEDIYLLFMDETEVLETKLSLFLLVFFFLIVPYTIAAILCVYPIWKRTLKKRRRYVFQIILSGSSFLSPLACLLMLNAYLKVSSSIIGTDGFSVTLSVGGWLTLLVALGMIIFLTCLSVQSGRLFGSEEERKRQFPWESES